VAAVPLSSLLSAVTTSKTQERNRAERHQRQVAVIEVFARCDQLLIGIAKTSTVRRTGGVGLAGDDQDGKTNGQPDASQHLPLDTGDKAEHAAEAALIIVEIA
jgi:hypothetical protein